ncbi:MAG TPA: hypothetical protein PLL44_11410 [Novosphingobium sp.]|jgi:hypothetical protein|nr:hypothetical protein [Novosphingobium sp.]
MLRRYAYAWLTLGFFAVSLVLHWYFGWKAYAAAAAEHGVPAETSAYLVEMARDTFENWQSEFLQLLWQVVGLAYFLYTGSPASKENDDRMEAKLDELLKAAGLAEAAEQIDESHFRHHGHSRPVGAAPRVPGR